MFKGKTYTGIILAVSHKEFLEIDIEKLKDNSSSVVFDLKAFLDTKVMSKGIVNMDRAVQAAKLSLSTDIDRAIADARIMTTNVVNGPKITALSPIPPGRFTFIP